MKGRNCKRRQMGSRAKAKCISTLRNGNSRLGIEGTAASAHLPPLHQPPLAVPGSSSPKKQHDTAQQEANALIEAFRFRLRAHLRVSESHGVAHSYKMEDECAADDDDCFTALAKATQPLDATLPFVAQFLRYLMQHIQALVQLKLAQESQLHHSGALQETSSNRSVGGASERCPNDRDEASSDESEDYDEATEDRTNQPLSPVKRSTFRTTRRSRRFPASRIPAQEHVVVTSSCAPLDIQLDLASVKLHSGTQPDVVETVWSVVQFPKVKPSLTRVETEALMQWAQAKLQAMTALQLQTSDSEEHEHVGAGSLARQMRFFTQELALQEFICYETARLVFDKCPTTARFLHGLFVSLVTIATRTIAHAERETEIHEQRRKNVQSELSRLETQLSVAQSALETLKTTLVTRQRHLLRERERIIRKRKKLNQLLCADQILIRSVCTLLQTELDIADEQILDAMASLNAARSGISSPAAVDDSRSRSASAEQFTLVHDLMTLVMTKYGHIPAVTQAKILWDQNQQDRADATPSSSTAAQRDREKVVVLDRQDIMTATVEFKSTLRRLTRTLSSKSPDSSLGWDARELWDHALFIPPPEDIQDLNRDVRALCALVEDHIIQQRLAPAVPVTHASVQTDISACVSFSPRKRANGFRLIALPATYDFDAVVATAAADHKATVDPKTNQLARDMDVQTQRILQEDHQELLDTFLPEGFRLFVQSIPADYVPHQLSLAVVHAIISYVFNEMWLLVQEEHQRYPRKFCATTSSDLVIPLASAHEYLYRIYLRHFRVASFVTCRLLDLLISASRLDTQSCKVQLFCRLLNLPGVDPLAPDAFWFVLKSLHLLQRACVATANYFLLDGDGENEFVPQSSAMEALGSLFHGASNDVMKRLRLRLSGLASVYGSMWIPAYSVMEFVLEEWKAAQESLLFSMEAQVMAAMEAVGAHPSASDTPMQLVSFEAFCHVFVNLRLKTNRLEAAQAYRQLLSQSIRCTESTIQPYAVNGISANRFHHNWIEMLMHVVNQAQQQQYITPTLHANASATAAANAMNPGVHLGPPAEAMLNMNRQLSIRFLRATWEQTKKDIIRALDSKFHDVGLQVRLVQQMDSIVKENDTGVQIGWKSFQQLIEISFTR